MENKKTGEANKVYYRRELSMRDGGENQPSLQDILSKRVIRERTKRNFSRERQKLAKEVITKRQELMSQIMKTRTKMEFLVEKIKRLDNLLDRLYRERVELERRLRRWKKLPILSGSAVVQKMVEKLNKRNPLMFSLVRHLDEINQQIDLYRQIRERDEQWVIKLQRNLEELKKGRDLWDQIEKFYIEKRQGLLTKEERQLYFREEVLAKLSLQEYLELWQRGNYHFLAHVSRQGIRDHNGMFYHAGGLAEFHQGMTKMLEDGRLRPPVYVKGLKGTSKEEIEAFLKSKGIFNFDSVDEAIEEFKRYLYGTLAEMPAFPDETAVHLSVEAIMDTLYGGERGNECFVIFPADFIASQYTFFSKGRGLIAANSDTARNDVSVWSSPWQKGILVNAGIVFLPKETPVDPLTGSRYQLEVITNPKSEGKKLVRRRVENEEKLLRAIASVILKPDVELVEAYEMYNKSTYWEQDQYKEHLSQVLWRKLKETGFDRIDFSYLVHKLIYLVGEVIEGREISEKELEYELEKGNVFYQKALNPIRAEDYWSNYFKQYPSQKPAHLVFYSGSPTTAVYDFLKNNGIEIGRKTKKEKDPFLGFEEHVVKRLDEWSTPSNSDPRVWRGLQEIETRGIQIIKKAYK